MQQMVTTDLDKGTVTISLGYDDGTPSGYESDEQLLLGAACKLIEKLTVVSGDTWDNILGVVGENLEVDLG